MSKVLGEIKFIGYLPRRGGAKFPVSLTLRMYASPFPNEGTLLLLLPGYLGREEEINWINSKDFARDVLSTGQLFNEIAAVNYEVDTTLLGVWFDSVMLGL